MPADIGAVMASVLMPDCDIEDDGNPTVDLPDGLDAGYLAIGS
jgi:hypothetical protein